MRIFSGIEKSDLLRIEWKQVVEFDREKEEKWKFACLDSRPTSVLCSTVNKNGRRLNASRLDKRERGESEIHQIFFPRLVVNRWINSITNFDTSSLSYALRIKSDNFKTLLAVIIL